jgi:hypothetical protein
MPRLHAGPVRKAFGHSCRLEQGLLITPCDKCADPRGILKIGASIAPSLRGRSMKEIERVGRDSGRLAPANQIKG